MAVTHQQISTGDVGAKVTPAALRGNSKTKIHDERLHIPPATANVMASDLASVLVEIDKDLQRLQLRRAHLYVVYQRLLAASSFGLGESS